MRTSWLVGVLWLWSCGKEAPAPVAPRAPSSTAAQDALWALAPEGAAWGVVVSPRGVELAERCAHASMALIARAPEFAEAQQKLTELLHGTVDAASLSLGELGLGREPGFAAFGLGEEDTVVVLPVADRDKFLAKVHGTRGATPDAGDAVDGNVCKMIAQRYVCASRGELFGRLGRGSLDRERRLVGARGDVEVAISDAVGGAPRTIAAVAELEPGAAIVRASIVGLPRELLEPLRAVAAAPADAERSAGFGAFDLRPFVGAAPDLPLGPGLTSGQLLRTISGPVTYVLRAGTANPDLRIPLAETGPAQRLIALCGTDQRLIALGAKLAGGVCHIAVPDSALAYDVWLEGGALRIGVRGGPAGVELPPSTIARELASGSWSAVMFGRGDVFDLSTIPGAADAMRRLTSKPESVGGLLGLMFVNEVGLGVRRDGDTLHAVLGLRSAWSNPSEIADKLLAISTADVLDGRSTRAARAIAESAPTSPFAADRKAGLAGAVSAFVPIGVVSALAVPSLMRSLERRKQTEASLHLDQLAKDAKTHFTEFAEFPKGTAALTPSRPCCSYPGHRCPVDPSAWSDPVWEALGFSVDEPHLYQYSYVSDGKTFTATAVGDLDCDGTSITYRLEGSAPHGNPKTVLTEPAPSAD